MTRWIGIRGRRSRAAALGASAALAAGCLIAGPAVARAAPASPGEGGWRFIRSDA